jgi:hypothetical protein
VDCRQHQAPPGAQELGAKPAQLEADTLYVVGGLYGNPAALAAVLERADQEPGGPATIVFNGDFHWLDVDPDDFRTISETVLAHHATKGNVEAELAAEDETAGCGCAYPDYVGDDVVDRSNQIIGRLRATAAKFPELVGRLGALPRYLTADEDAWYQQRCGRPARLRWHQLRRDDSPVERSPAAPDSLYGTAVGALRYDALPIRFDQQRWQRRYLAQWPRSPGHRSYFGRITGGTHLRLVQAARGGVQLTAPSEPP